MPFVSPYDKPTRLEALRYYRRVSDAFKLDVVFDEAVVAVTRDAASDAAGSARRRHAFRAGRPALRAWTDGRHRHGRLRFSQSHGHSGRGFAACVALLLAAASVLSEKRRDRRRQELGGGGGARSLSRRRARDDRASRRLDAGFHQVLGEAGYRQSNQGRHRSPRASTPRVAEIRPTSVIVNNGNGAVESIDADAVFLLTGYGADTTLLRNAGIKIDAGDMRPRLRRANVRNQCPGDLCRRRDGGRRAERPDLHRERPLPRRASH